MGNSRDSSGLEQTKGNMQVSTNPPWKQLTIFALIVKMDFNEDSEYLDKISGNVLDVDKDLEVLTEWMVDVFCGIWIF